MNDVELTVTNEGDDIHTLSVTVGDGTSVEITLPKSTLLEILADLHEAVKTGEKSTHTVTFLGKNEVN